MACPPTKMTLEGFVDHFGMVQNKMHDHKFVWVLGAGASASSGIPVGSRLVDRWLKEMYLREVSHGEPLETWATEQNLGIKGFTYEERASFYPRIYERRFCNYPDEGFADLENEMAGKDPSPGYSILAAALAHDSHRHNAVITTNFDNLIADALAIYTDSLPFVCGHESLTGFVRVSMRRPLICKIHRDLLLAPQNDHHSLRRLNDAWGKALRSLFEHYTPLFIGYGGNDDTLMDLLESLQPGDIKGRLIWTYYEGSDPANPKEPGKRIQELVEYHKGILVPVPEFDLLMILLGEKMGIGLLNDKILERAKKRSQAYRDRVQELDITRHPAVARAFAETVDKSKGWWAWDQKARVEKDPVKGEAIYRSGLKHCPESPELTGNFANFLNRVRKDYNEAEKYYLMAMEIDPSYVNAFGNFANFLKNIQKNYDKAEEYYLKAMEIDPSYVNAVGNFANFLAGVRNKPDEAEKYYRKALKLDPSYSYAAVNFVGFLLGMGRITESASWFENARTTLGSSRNQLLGEFYVYSLIIDSADSKKFDSHLNEMKSLLISGYSRGSWSFDRVLAYAKSHVSSAQYDLIESIAAAVLDESKVPIALQKINDWFSDPPQTSKTTKKPTPPSPRKKRPPKKKPD